MTRPHHHPRAVRLIGGIVALSLTFAGLAMLGVVALQAVGVDVFEVRVWEAGR